MKLDLIKCENGIWIEKSKIVAFELITIEGKPWYLIHTMDTDFTGRISVEEFEVLEKFRTGEN